MQSNKKSVVFFLLFFFSYTYSYNNKNVKTDHGSPYEILFTCWLSNIFARTATLPSILRIYHPHFITWQAFPIFLKVKIMREQFVNLVSPYQQQFL